MSVLNAIIEAKKTRISDAKASLPLSELKARVRELTLIRDFVSALVTRKKNIALIAEIKKASPSKGVIKHDFNHLEIADIYQNCQVDACSVITEQDFFYGSPSYISDVKKILTCPILRKDFIFDEYQIYESKMIGADCILLISSCLSLQQSVDLSCLAQEIGLSVLYEINSQEDIEKALLAGVKIIGINNRDLKTFKVDLNTTLNIKRYIPDGYLVVSESGINTSKDVSLLSLHKIDAMLVGTYFMQSRDIASAIKSLYTF